VWNVAANITAPIFARANENCSRKLPGSSSY
jgi:hypothetical protein